MHVSRLHSLALALAAALAGTLLAAPEPAAAKRGVPDRFFGVAAPELYWMSAAGEDERVRRHLAAIRRAGIDWVRSDAFWSRVEPTAPVEGRHTYEWAVLDRYVAALARHRLRFLPIAWGTPGWARRAGAVAAGCRVNAGVVPWHYGTYGDYVEALVSRYGRGGSFWSQRPRLPYRPLLRVELWNEPNWSAWCPAPDPEGYAALLAEGVDGAHRGNRRVAATMGGLVMLDRDFLYPSGAVRGLATGAFLARITAARPRLRKRLDAVAVHPYAPRPAANLRLLSWSRRLMASSGLDRQDLFVSEFGWHTQGGEGAVRERIRARRYRRQVHRFARTDCRLKGIAPHAWVTEEADADDREHWFGIAEPQTAKLHRSGRVYKRRIALHTGRARKSPPPARLDVC